MEGERLQPRSKKEDKNKLDSQTEQKRLVARRELVFEGSCPPVPPDLLSFFFFHTKITSLRTQTHKAEKKVCNDLTRRSEREEMLSHDRRCLSRLFDRLVYHQMKGEAGVLKDTLIKSN